VILGLSFDPTGDNKAFRDKFDFPYDLLSDVDTSVSASFGAADQGQAKASRVSVLIAPDGTIAKTYATVKPADHPDEVLKDLAALG
jgi:thioredoxin-dependent peroxiredoxin